RLDRPDDANQSYIDVYNLLLPRLIRNGAIVLTDRGTFRIISSKIQEIVEPLINEVISLLVLSTDATSGDDLKKALEVLVKKNDITAAEAAYFENGTLHDWERDRVEKLIVVQRFRDLRSSSMDPAVVRTIKKAIALVPTDIEAEYVTARELIAGEHEFSGRAQAVISELLHTGIPVAGKELEPGAEILSVPETGRVADPELRIVEELIAEGRTGEAVKRLHPMIEKLAKKIHALKERGESAKAGQFSKVLASAYDLMLEHDLFVSTDENVLADEKRFPVDSVPSALLKGAELKQYEQKMQEIGKGSRVVLLAAPENRKGLSVLRTYYEGVLEKGGAPVIILGDAG
ncbi:MAG TPA: hypothetical protein VJC03_03170, partial [bacterium]|nr:hypothetical protein [bacterium]